MISCLSNIWNCVNISTENGHIEHSLFTRLIGCARVRLQIYRLLALFDIFLALRGMRNGMTCEYYELISLLSCTWTHSFTWTKCFFYMNIVLVYVYYSYDFNLSDSFNRAFPRTISTEFNLIWENYPSSTYYSIKKSHNTRWWWW